MAASPPVVLIAPVRANDARGRPTVGIRPDYAEAVTRAGGLPLVLAAVGAGVDARQAGRALAAADALVLPGGADLDPRLYGEEPVAEIQPLPAGMSELYLSLARAAVRRDLPLLGICLGCQVLNVALGGTLVQHLGAPGTGKVPHVAASGGDSRHEVTVEPGSRLARVIGREPGPVMSHHHQALARLGHGLAVTARAADGVIEAVERPASRFCLGVQWHPERMPGEDSTERLFAALIRAARSFRRRA